MTWMLTPFIKISDVTPSLITGSFRIDQKGDSVTFIVRTFHSTLFLIQRYRNIGSKVTQTCRTFDFRLSIWQDSLREYFCYRGHSGKAAREFSPGERTFFLDITLLTNF